MQYDFSLSLFHARFLSPLAMHKEVNLQITITLSHKVGLFWMERAVYTEL